MASYSASEVTEMLDVVSSIHDYYSDLEKIDSILHDFRILPQRYKKNKKRKAALRFAQENRDDIVGALETCLQKYVTFPEEIKENLEYPFDVELIAMTFDIDVSLQ